MVSLRPTGKLWHHRDFMRLWFSDTVTQVGNTFTQLALPIIADLTLGAGPFQLGIMLALQLAPFPILGLFVGVWADRFQKRNIMIICNLGRMVTLATIPVAYVFGVLSLDQLYLVGLSNGIFQVFFDISYQAYLPNLIESSDLLEGNSKLQTSAAGAQLVGPSLAGLVIQLIGGAYAITVDAIGYLTSSLSLISIKKKEPKRDRKDAPNFFKEMREGIDVVFHNRILTHIMGATATSNLGSSMLGAPFIIFVLNILHFSKLSYGILGSFGALGFLVGVLITQPITKRLGLGMTLAVSIGSSFLIMLNPIAQYGYAFFVLAALSFLSALLIPSYNINQISLRQAMVDVKLQGRMNATVRTIVWGTMPLGSLLGGILGSMIGIVNTIYISGFICGTACLWIITGPVFKLKEHPKTGTMTANIEDEETKIPP
jgi:Transmembrane secretion effector